jgi:DNA polymerase-3 subunit delta'
MSSVFDSIIGQPAAVATLTAAWQSGRLPHALIFAGPVGVGKRTTADKLAALFLCPKPIGMMNCCNCQACTLVDAGTHPDVSISRRQDIRLYKESVARDMTIDVIRRQVVEPASLKPALGHGKVFIVEEADRMNDNAQNALLKTLEEPQGLRTLIILLATSEEELLSTVRSRSRTIRFGPLSQRQTAELLATKMAAKLTEKQPPHPPALLQDAARLSEGSVGLASLWLDLGLVPVATGLDTRMKQIIARQPAADLAEWLKKGADEVVDKMLKQDPEGSKDQFKRETLTTLFAIGTQQVRQALRSEAATASESAERLCNMVDQLHHAGQLLSSNVNADLVLANLSAQLHA